MLAFRLEWQNQGPFWDDRIFLRLVRRCRQITPEWKKTHEHCSTFLEAYVAHAESPYDVRTISEYLNHNTENIQFGFVGVDKMFAEFQLHDELYQRQFSKLLDTERDLRVACYDVDELAASWIQVLYHNTPKRRRFIEAAKTYQDFRSL
jgi:hypothetical protein